VSIFAPCRLGLAIESGDLMQIAGFTFSVGEIDGFRFIEAVFPESIDPSRVWAAASSYPTMWDEPRPTVTLNDVSNLGELEPEPRRVLRWVLQQNSLRAQLVATSWVTRGNERAREQIAEVLGEVGRPVDTIFELRDQALEHIAREIRRWREATGG
jgi:hypothetical protein